MDSHGTYENILIILRFKVNNEPAILGILAEAKIIINLKKSTEEECELFLVIQHMTEKLH